MFHEFFPGIRLRTSNLQIDHLSGDASTETPGLAQVKCETIGNILRQGGQTGCEDGAELGKRIALWASRASDIDNGKSLVRIVQLSCEEIPDVVKEAAKAVEAEKRAKVEKELDHLRASIRRSVASISDGLEGLRSDRCCGGF